jgi:hypothetical protein
MSSSPALRWIPPRRLQAGEVLRAAGRLFLLSWLHCLPLALLGVVVSGAPGALAARSGAARGLDHGLGWWLLYAGTVLVMLVCYGAVALRQQALVEGRRVSLWTVVGRSLRALPAAVVTAIVYVLLAPLLLPLVALSLAWLAAVFEQRGPLAACRSSFQATRGHLWPLTLTWLSVLAGVLVFIMLMGVFYGVVMVAAGQAGARNGALISQVVFTALLSLPVIYVSGVLVSCRAVLTADGHSPT